MPWSCRLCILIAAQSSWLSLLSYGKLVWFDHHNRTVCGRNVAFLVRIARPGYLLSIYLVYLSELPYLAGLILSDLVLRMLFAIFTLAVGFSCLWNVDLIENKLETIHKIVSLLVACGVSHRLNSELAAKTDAPHRSSDT